MKKIKSSLFESSFIINKGSIALALITEPGAKLNVQPPLQMSYNNNLGTASQARWEACSSRCRRGEEVEPTN